MSDLDRHNELTVIWKQSIAARVSALERTQMETNAVKQQQDDDINRIKGRVGDTAERIKALEDRLQTVWIAPINVLKERCFALENAVASLKLLVPPPQPPCPPEVAPDACVVGSAYPCEERQAFAVTNCIYFCGGVCDYKRTHGKRPPKGFDSGVA